MPISLLFQFDEYAPGGAVRREYKASKTFEESIPSCRREDGCTGSCV